MTIECVQVDYADPQQMAQLLDLLNDYATDPMGGGSGLSEECRQNLAKQMAARSYLLSYIAYVDGEPAGLMNCVEGFSTFKCAPLLNIHDIAVKKAFRGQGIANRLLAAAETAAKKRGCCKLTLEVLTGNSIAIQAYQKFGFSPYELDPEMGQALFFEKSLTTHH